MTLQKLADAMTSGLQEQGIIATPGPSMNNQYATKLLLSIENGLSLGAVKLYVGGDMADPLWNLLDMTPEGRGETWFPEVEY